MARNGSCRCPVRSCVLLTERRRREQEEEISTAESVSCWPATDFERVTKIEMRDLQEALAETRGLEFGDTANEHDEEECDSARRARPLPRNLRDAVALLTASKEARAILGDGFVAHFVRTREWDVRQYERAVTSWALESYFELA